MDTQEKLIKVKDLFDQQKELLSKLSIEISRTSKIKNAFK